MKKMLAALVAIAMVGCVDDVTPIDPSDSHVFGFWNMEVDATACERPVQQLDVELTLEADDSVTVWWGLHSPDRYTADVVFTETGAEVVLETTDGPPEHVVIVMTDDGADASALVTYGRLLGTDWCEVGPVEATMSGRVR